MAPKFSFLSAMILYRAAVLLGLVKKMSDDGIIFTLNRDMGAGRGQTCVGATFLPSSKLRKFFGLFC